LQTAQQAAPAWPDLRERVATLEAQLAAKPAAPAYPNLSGRVSELEAEVAQARQAAPAYPDLSARVKELEGTLATTQARATELSGTAEERARLAASLQSELKQTQSALADARQPVPPAYPDLRERVTTLEAQLAAKPAAPAYPDLSGKVRELETQVTTLAAAREAAGKQGAGLTDANAQIAQLRADRERMQKMLADAGKQMRDSAADAARIKDLETQVAAASSRPRPVAPPGYMERVRELEGQLAQARQAAVAPAYPDLSGKVGELETKLAVAGTAQGDLQKKLDETNAALQAAAKNQNADESAQLRRERDELSGRVTNLTGEIAQLRADRERMQRMIADAGKQMRDATADTARIKELEAQTGTLQAALTTAQAQASQFQTALDAKPGAPSYPDLSGRVAELETKLDAADRAAAAKSAAPAYPDLRDRVATLEAQVAAKPPYPDLSGRVRQLEGQLAAAPKSGSAPAYPDLSGRVNELEATLADSRRQLAQTQTALQAAAVPPPATNSSAPNLDATALQKQLAETEEKLAISLRGYAELARERDALAAGSNKTADTAAAEKNALAAQVAQLSSEVDQLKSNAQSSAGSTSAEISRLNDALAALQRSSAKNTTDLAATRALAQQLQGSNSVLANENYQLKTMLARNVGGPTPANVASSSTPVPPATPGARTHTVAAGDSLSRISQRYYGAANRWPEIYNANRDRIAGDGVLRVGTELRIP
jgi:chromosome segregation ATPase